MKPLIVTIPGKAFYLAKEGSPGPAARRALDSAQVVRRGRGSQAILSMTPTQAHELADYFWGIAGAVGEMTAAERDGGTEHLDAQTAVLRIEGALRSQG